MIERIVLVKLKDEHTTADRLGEIASHCREVMTGVTGVTSVSIGTPADEASAGSWDLCFVVRLDSIDDVGPYAADPAHRELVDEYLKPRWEIVKAWNFLVP